MTMASITDLLCCACLALSNCDLVEHVVALSGKVSPLDPGSPTAVRGGHLAASKFWWVALHEFGICVLWICVSYGCTFCRLSERRKQNMIFVPRLHGLGHPGGASCDLLSCISWGVLGIACSKARETCLS